LRKPAENMKGQPRQSLRLLNSMFSGCFKASKSGLRAAIFLVYKLASKPLRRGVLPAVGEIRMCREICSGTL